jgi:hypothetical protein
MLELENSDVNSNSAAGRIALIVFFFILAYVFVVMEPDTFKESLTEEVHQIDKTLGDKSALVIINRAKSWYRFTFEKSGFSGFLNTLTMETGLKGDTYWRTPMARISENLKMLWYQACMRASVTLFWAFLILPMFLAALADGYYKRKIKQHEFTISSTGYFRLSYWLAILGIVCVKLYFIVPSAGLMNPLFPLFVGLGIALLARNLISNASKVM